MMMNKEQIKILMFIAFREGIQYGVDTMIKPGVPTQEEIETHIIDRIESILKGE